MDEEVDEINKTFHWTFTKVVWAISVFIFAGVAEIVGGYMVWAAIRGNDNQKKAWWYALIGSFILVIYGFIPCLQPTDTFGRIYAVYGGFFIVLSFVFGWIFDGTRPDRGDVVGSAVAIAGVLIIMLWPRNRE
mmetsp:Transcript_13114/g.19866  ORF Transcript_13114/g.19866 Transcript_13114/m.19866 type:complete len:133 (-) Transcript_13114:56-454(-)